MWQFERSIEIGQEAIDELGHVNNVETLRWVEMIGRAHLEAVGYPLERLLAAGGAFVARRHEIDYLAAVFLGEKLDVRTRVTGMGGARSIREVAIYRGDTVVAEARTEWVFVDSASMRPKRMPAEILNAFGLN